MSEDHSVWNEDEQLDRLVDGELPRGEYDRLLKSFDENPQGWRRCALAFLEAQAWQKEMAADRNIPAVGPRPEPKTPPSSREFNWTPVLAVAASFLIAFALGLSFRLDWFGTGQANDPSYIAEQESQPNSEGTATPRSDVPESTVDSEKIRLVLDRGDGTGQPIDLPVMEWSPDRQRMLAQPSIPVPPEVQRMLQQAGHELRTKRRFVPFQTQDGREVLIPLDQLEITPVRSPGYQ